MRTVLRVRKLFCQLADLCKLDACWYRSNVAVAVLSTGLDACRYSCMLIKCGRCGVSVNHTLNSVSSLIHSNVVAIFVLIAVRRLVQ